MKLLRVVLLVILLAGFQLTSVQSENRTPPGCGLTVALVARHSGIDPSSLSLCPGNTPAGVSCVANHTDKSKYGDMTYPIVLLVHNSGPGAEDWWNRTFGIYDPELSSTGAPFSYPKEKIKGLGDEGYLLPFTFPRLVPVKKGGKSRWVSLCPPVSKEEFKEMKKRGNLQLSVRKGKDFYLFCFYGYRRLGTTIWDAERAIALASAVLFESR